MPASLPTRASAFLFLWAVSAALPLQAQLKTGHSDPPSETLVPLTPRLRARLWVRTSTDATAWLVPGLEAAFSMAHPPRRQQPAWSVGAEGFVHLYSGYLARQSAATSAQTVAAALLHEDNRYLPAPPGSALRRAAHAVSFTVIDRRASAGSGHRMPAISSLAAAFTAAELANTWLAPQFQNSTHLVQRTLTSLGSLAGSELATEFRPDAVRLMRRVTHGISRVAIHAGRKASKST